MAWYLPTLVLWTVCSTVCASGQHAVSYTGTFSLQVPRNETQSLMMVTPLRIAFYNYRNFCCTRIRIVSVKNMITQSFNLNAPGRPRLTPTNGIACHFLYWRELFIQFRLHYLVLFRERKLHSELKYLVLYFMNDC